MIIGIGRGPLEVDSEMMMSHGVDFFYKFRNSIFWTIDCRNFNCKTSSLSVNYQFVYIVIFIYSD